MRVKQHLELEKKVCPFKPKIISKTPTKGNFVSRISEFEQKKKEKLDKLQKNLDGQFAYTPHIKPYQPKKQLSIIQ